MGPRLTGRRLPTWEVPSCPTMVSVLMQLKGAYASHKNMQQFIALYKTNHRFVAFM